METKSIEELVKPLTDYVDGVVYHHQVIAGQEGFLGDTASAIADASLKGVNWVGGKIAGGVKTALTTISKTIIRSYGNNATKIATVNKYRSASDVDSFKATKKLIDILTANGSISEASEDIEYLVKELKHINQFILDVEAYEFKRIDLISKIKSVNSTESAVKLVADMDKLTFPVPKFKVNNNSMSETDILPGGKVFVYSNESGYFKITSKETERDYEDSTIDKDELFNVLKALTKLNIEFQTLSKGNDRYIKCVEKFNTVVKETFNHLDSLKDNVSGTLIKDLESRIEGDPRTFSFFGSFLPKVASYVDTLINGSTDTFIKQIN